MPLTVLPEGSYDSSQRESQRQRREHPVPRAEPIEGRIELDRFLRVLDAAQRRHPGFRVQELEEEHISGDQGDRDRCQYPRQKSRRSSWEQPYRKQRARQHLGDEALIERFVKFWRVFLDQGL